MNLLFAVNEFQTIDALVLLLTGLVGLPIAVFQLLSKKPEVVQKRKSFILILLLSLGFAGVGLYLLVTGKSLR